MRSSIFLKSSEDTLLQRKRRNIYRPGSKKVISLNPLCTIQIGCILVSHCVVQNLFIHCWFLVSPSRPRFFPVNAHPMHGESGPCKWLALVSYSLFWIKSNQPRVWNPWHMKLITVKCWRHPSLRYCGTNLFDCVREVFYSIQISYL